MVHEQNNDFSRLSINCRGKLLSLHKPVVMGILNLTPDSFYDGGKYNLTEESYLHQAEKILKEGADIIDVGGMSTRPNAPILSKEAEWERLEKPLKQLVQKFPEAIFSIDTEKEIVAEKALEIGVHIVNDVSGGDENMYELVAKYNAPYILMHNRGNAQTMQQQTTYENILIEMYQYFDAKIQQLKKAGVLDIIIDAGFGFAKTTAQNFKILKNFSYFENLGFPILAGISRKSMIYKTLEIDALHALNGTTALHMVALQQGAKILRVHDVREAKETIQLYVELEKVC